MSIDGIGKPGAGPLPALQGVTPPAGGAPPVTSFRVERPTEAGATRSDGAPGAVDAPLARLERGEIDVAQYLDLRVEGATSHLRHLAPDDLEFIRRTLHEELSRDPALIELVRRACGSAPVDPEP